MNALKKAVLSGFMALAFFLTFHTEVFAATLSANLDPGEQVAYSRSTYASGKVKWYVDAHNYYGGAVDVYIKNLSTGNRVYLGRMAIGAPWWNPLGDYSWEATTTRPGYYVLQLVCLDGTKCEAEGYLSW